ncbi:hypothetical protein KVR01_002833 [Diaporthe batatas]|uniref:uncharacterized protein n=1 Tax=Diaporthe batatas TaxID=748121 RepID=UPI001D04D77E|nr:uncharacterized protein KVR01_002833 [Diaporthe batatas]KAG8167144.1 hypothetical protein KVR01_002833 [Diaporthe batatas]
MYTNTILSVLAMAATVVTASPVEVRQQTSTINPFPLTISQLAYSHGHQIVALTPTRTTLGDSCNTNVNATRTAVVQAQNSGFSSNPLCGHEFSLEGVTGLTLLCADSAEHGEAASQVTAVATNGEQTHECVALPLNVYPFSCGVGSSIWQLYSCQ